MPGGPRVKGWVSLCARPLSSQVLPASSQALQVLLDPSSVLPVPSQYPPLLTPKCRFYNRPAVALAFTLGEAGSGNATASARPRGDSKGLPPASAPKPPGCRGDSGHLLHVQGFRS